MKKIISIQEQSLQLKTERIVELQAQVRDLKFENKTLTRINNRLNSKIRGLKS